MFETKNQPLISTGQFIARVSRCILLGVFFIFIALCIGMIGYRFFEGMSWLDSFTNAALTLADMGLVSPLLTPAGKIFAGVFALLSELVFLSVMGIVFAPIIHRLLHRFHLDE